MSDEELGQIPLAAAHSLKGQTRQFWEGVLVTNQLGKPHYSLSPRLAHVAKGERQASELLAHPQDAPKSVHSYCLRPGEIGGELGVKDQAQGAEVF